MAPWVRAMTRPNGIRDSVWRWSTASRGTTQNPSYLLELDSTSLSAVFPCLLAYLSFFPFNCSVFKFLSLYVYIVLEANTSSWHYHRCRPRRLWPAPTSHWQLVPRIPCYFDLFLCCDSPDLLDNVQKKVRCFMFPPGFLSTLTRFNGYLKSDFLW